MARDPQIVSAQITSFDPDSPMAGLARVYTTPMIGIEVSAVNGRHVDTDTGTLVDFSTGAYLGLDLDIRTEDVDEARRWGLRNGWSRATGTTGLTAAFENELAAALQMDAVRLSTSAALINYSAFHAFAGAFPIAVFDQDAHITLKQGIFAAYPSARRHAFPNNDLAALERTLARLPAGTPKIVAIDGIYSMKGSEAPVLALVELCAAHDAVLYIDDVHGFGVRGPNGLGVIERIPVPLRKHVLLLGSFAKSASNPVAFLAYDEAHWVAIEAIPAVNYSGPPSNLHVAICRRHLAAFPALASRRERLQRASERLHTFCANEGIRTQSSTGSPIVAVGVHDSCMEEVADHLHAVGILCKVAVFPVVRRGDEVMRFTLTAAHTDADLKRLEQALLPIIPMLQRTR